MHFLISPRERTQVSHFPFPIPRQGIKLNILTSLPWDGMKFDGFSTLWILDPWELQSRKFCLLRQNSHRSKNVPVLLAFINYPSCINLHKYCRFTLKSFPDVSVGKESTCNVGDPGSIPGWGRSSGEGNGNPLQYSCLGNSMDRGAWWASVHQVTKSQTQMSD